MWSLSLSKRLVFVRLGIVCTDKSNKQVTKLETIDVLTEYADWSSSKYVTVFSDLAASTKQGRTPARFFCASFLYVLFLRFFFFEDGIMSEYLKWGWRRMGSFL